MRASLVYALLLPSALALSQIPPQIEDSIANGEALICPEGWDPQDCIEASKSFDRQDEESEKDEIPAGLEEKLAELDQLHEQLFGLEDQVWQKESEIAGLLDFKHDGDQSAQRKHLKEELAECDSIKCVLHAIFERAHHKLRKMKAFFHKHHRHHRHGHHKHHRHGHCRPSPPDDKSPFPPPPDRDGPPPPGHDRGGFFDEKFQRFHRHHHRHHHKGPFFMFLGLLFLVVVLPVLFIRRCCCRVVERAHARMDRRRARRARREACRQKFRNWWKSFIPGNVAETRERRQPWSASNARNNSFESREQLHSWLASFIPRRSAGPREKSAMVVEQEALLHEHMQAEIQELRNATAVVDSIVSAEEGRSAFTSELEARERGRRSLSLPGYRNQSSGSSDIGPPPDYESEVNADVADGFQYDPDVVVYTPSESEETSSENSALLSNGKSRPDDWKN